MNRSHCPLALFAFALTSCSLSSAQTPAAPCPSAPVADHGQSVGGKALASPAATADVSLNGGQLTLRYNAPSVRCRTIMGNVVPYGKVWRTGANPATSFTTDEDVTIGTLHVPAGKYTLYTLPAAPGSPWMLIINKQTGQWGTVYDQAQDLGRTPMHAEKLPSPQEVMSLSFDRSSANSTQLHMRWEGTDEWVEVRASK